MDAAAVDGKKFVNAPKAQSGYGPVADLYDYVVPYRNRQDVDFYVKAAAESGGPVLEVGCGTGRVLVPTARAGVEITGVDSSAEMLEICRRRLAEEPATVQSRAQLVEGDMRNFKLPPKFRLATIPFRPFQHLTTVADQLSCLESIRRHLTDDGLLIFDLFNPSLDALANQPIGTEHGEEPEFSMPDGRRVIRRHKTVAKDLFQQVGQYELIYYITHPDGREERLCHSFALRHLFRFEAEHQLARAGFAVENLYADFDRRAYGSKDPGDLIFVARKAGEEKIDGADRGSAPRA